MRDSAQKMNLPSDAALGSAPAEVVNELAAACHDDVCSWVAELCKRVDRDIKALEVVSAIQGRDERGHQRVGGDAQPFAQPRGVGARAEALGVDSVRHHDELPW